MRKSISAVIAVIAFAPVLAGCGGGGISKLGKDAGEAASGAAKEARSTWDETNDIRQVHSAGCRRAKIREWSDTLQGDASDEAPTC